MSANWLRRLDHRNQHAIEGAADRARAGSLRRSSGSMVTAGFLTTMAVLGAIMAFATADEPGGPPSLLIAVALAVGAVVGLVVATWRAEVSTDQIVFTGLLCPLKDVPLSGLTEVTIRTYNGEWTVPRLQRQCIELRYRAVTPTRLRWFWRRPPWGDEASDHLDLIQFAAVVRAAHARSTR